LSWQFLHYGALGLAAVALTLAFASGRTAQLDSYAACAEAGYPVTDSNPPLCRAGRLNFTGTLRPPEASAPPVSVQALEILVNGDTATSLPAAHQVLINSQAEWQTYWQQAHAGIKPLPPLIPVDFSTASVLAAGLGPKPTGGYSLRFTGVTSGPSGTIAGFTESSPSAGCATTQAVSNRYTVVRTAKLAPPVSFRVTSVKHSC
jgi:hypothetical protein